LDIVLAGLKPNQGIQNFACTGLRAVAVNYTISVMMGTVIRLGGRWKCRFIHYLAGILVSLDFTMYPNPSARIFTDSLVGITQLLHATTMFIVIRATG
jgi:hypothetical protein